MTTPKKSPAKKAPWGGKREGAGRKPGVMLTRTIQIRCTPEQEAEFLRRGGAAQWRLLHTIPR